MYGKEELFLERIETTGPLDLIVRPDIGATANPAYPGGFFIFMNQLLIGSLLFQPRQHCDRADGPLFEKPVYFATWSTSHAC